MVELPYKITVAAGSLDELPGIVRDAATHARVAIITDDNVGRHYAARVARALGVDASAVFEIRSGEESKTRETWTQLTDDLLERGYRRDSAIVALGGGVVGDVAGFVAATFMRGVPVIQVPTSLLAMVDAAVGGKTGVDTPAGKNLVGAFHQPAAVVVDPLLLQTLPLEHLRAGFAEIVKHGVVADAEYFQRASAFIEHWSLGNQRGIPDLTAIIQRSIEIKTLIVGRDEREAGLRKVLNFGHTIGHAIEAATSFETLHGEAVAIGLVTEARMAEHMGIASSGTARVIERACRAAGLPTSVPGISADTLIGFTRADKKVRAGVVEYALPKRIGEMAGADRGWTMPVDDDVVREALGA